MSRSAKQSTNEFDSFERNWRKIDSSASTECRPLQTQLFLITYSVDEDEYGKMMSKWNISLCRSTFPVTTKRSDKREIPNGHYHDVSMIICSKEKVHIERVSVGRSQSKHLIKKEYFVSSICVNFFQWVYLVTSNKKDICLLRSSYWRSSFFSSRSGDFRLCGR